MWYLVSLFLLFVGTLIACAGYWWGVLLSLPFAVCVLGCSIEKNAKIVKFYSKIFCRLENNL